MLNLLIVNVSTLHLNFTFKKINIQTDWRKRCTGSTVKRWRRWSSPWIDPRSSSSSLSRKTCSSPSSTVWSLWGSWDSSSTNEESWMSVRKIGCVVSGKTALGWMEQFFKTLPALVFLLFALFVRNKQKVY